MSIKTWEERLAAMDHSKGTSDKMRKAAMLAEIRELRAALREVDRTVARAIKQAERGHRAEMRRAERRVSSSIEMTKNWIRTARRYQKELVIERTKK